MFAYRIASASQKRYCFLVYLQFATVRIIVVCMETAVAPAETCSHRAQHGIAEQDEREIRYSDAPIDIPNVIALDAVQ